MAYTKTNWQNGVTPVNADNMNKIENELETLDQAVGGGGGESIPNGFTVKIQGRGLGAIYKLWYLGKLRNSITNNGTTYNTDYGYNVIQFSDNTANFNIDNCVFCILKMQEVGGAITPYVSVSLEAVVNGVLKSNYRKSSTTSEVLTVNLIGDCTIDCGDDG